MSIGSMNVWHRYRHFLAIVFAVALSGSWSMAVRAQAPEARFAAVIEAARAHPGCLGIDTGQTRSGRQVIFAWFENKAALVSWYKSEAHQRAMKIAFPNQTFNREPLPDTPDDSGQILAIVSLKPSDAPPREGMGLPIGSVGIELYTPVPGGVAVGGRFSPRTVRVPALREFELPPSSGPSR